MQLPKNLAATSPESLMIFVRAEMVRHCWELLHAAASRLELSEISSES